MAAIELPVLEILAGQPGPPGGPLASLPSALVVGQASQNLADVGTNASTTTYQTAIDVDLPLPAGTWSVYVVGGVSVRHSASGAVDVKAMVGATSGTVLARNVGPTTPEAAGMVGTAEDTGLAGGTVTCAVKYKPGVAGTASADDCFIFAVALKTN